MILSLFSDSQLGEKLELLPESIVPSEQYCQGSLALAKNNSLSVAKEYRLSDKSLPRPVIKVCSFSR